MKRLLLLLLALGCDTAPDRTLDPPEDDALSVPSYLAHEEPYAVCFAAGASCGPEIVTPCCEGLFCSTDLLSYAPGACAAPQPDGSFCIEDAHCASGRCLANMCVDPTCREEGAECYDDMTACCPGLFCAGDPGTYGVALCTVPLPAGAFCLDDAACASGSCIDSACQ